MVDQKNQIDIDDINRSEWQKSWDEVSLAKKLGNDQLVNQNSGCVEWYTPKWITDLCAELMGGIDLDPASCEVANKFVGAKNFYTKEDDGLHKDWFGNVFMNHPFGKPEVACKRSKSEPSKFLCNKERCKSRGYHNESYVPGNADWINKLVNEYENDHFRRGCALTFASTSEGWFKPLYQFPHCWLYDRVNFIDASGNEIKGAPKGCVISFPGIEIQKIHKLFSKYGHVEQGV